MTSISLDTIPRLTSYDDVDFVLRSRSFLQGGHWAGGLVVDNTLLQLNHKEHFARRRVESAVFRAESLVHYETNLLRASIEREARRLATSDEHVELNRTVRNCLVPVTSALVGIDGVNTDAEVERFRYFVESFSAVSRIEFAPLDQHDQILDHGRRAIEEFLEEYYTEAVARRLTAIRSGHDPDLRALDVLTVLLMHASDELDDASILREVISYIVANTHTSTQAAVSSIRRLFTALAEGQTTETQIRKDIGYVRMAVDEAMRLNPPAPLVFRIPTESVTVPSGVVLPAGERFGMDFATASRDTEVFGPDADEFRPGRELPRGARAFGFAFGGGPHMCIGRPFATAYGERSGEAESVGTIARIVQGLFRAGISEAPFGLNPSSEWDLPEFWVKAPAMGGESIDAR